MRKARPLLALLLVFSLAAAAPMASAQDTIQNPRESTPTTLYFHIFDTINRFVINTQPMNSEFFDVGGANFPTIPGTGSPTPIETGVNIEDGYDMNTVYGYSTAGPVEYEFTENGKPRFHPERGIAAQVDIDNQVTPLAYIYIDVRDVVGGESATTLPEFNVRVTVQEGDNPGLDANLDEGKDIMIGQAKFHLLNVDGSVDPGQTASDGFCTGINCAYLCGDFGAPCLGEGQPVPQTPIPIQGGNAALGGQAVGDVPILVPDESGIIETVVPLQIVQNYIPKKEAFNVRIDWYQTPDPSGAIVGEDEFTTGWLRLASDPDHLSRLEFNIFNPIYFSFIHPQVAANTLLIHAGGNSPWGTYDVNLDEITIDVEHESGTKVPQNQLLKLLNSNEHVHGLHDEDAQFTYLWDFRDHNAELGEYTIRMSVTNDAKDDDGDYADSATAFGQAKFVVTETEAIGFDTEGNEVEQTAQSDDVEAPGAGLVATIALLGAALVASRRFQA